jgi:asparagine synthase (glutamine-hydrolysing)
MSHLTHRGPDAKGVFLSEDRTVGLAHNRLSIIDLSDAANQPFTHPSTRLVLVFNGEIYNYRSLATELRGLGWKFRTSSDTEVLLAAFHHFGPSCLTKLDGMFAFAVYDPVNHRIHLARDIAGEKPLYYMVGSDSLIFASETPAIVKGFPFGWKICPQSFEYYLTYGYAPANESLLTNVHEVPPATLLSFCTKSGQITTDTYWSPPAGNFPRQPIASETLAEELFWNLETSIKNRLIADVPVGVLLSGGLDSSLVTSIAAKNLPNLNTFTVTFQDFPEANEADHALKISRAFETQHHVLEAGSLSPLRFLEITRTFTEPIGDPSLIPTYLVCELVRPICKVVLGGDGGDELFGGYKSYTRLCQLERISRYLPSTIRKLVSSLATFLPPGYPGKRAAQALGTINNQPFQPQPSIFDAREQRLLLNGGFSTPPKKATLNNLPAVSSNSDLLTAAMIDDFKNYLPGDILRKVDRMSMLNSLEVRAPLLSKDIVNFAFQKVPRDLKVTEKNRKILLKESARKILPQTFDYQRKAGFCFPLGSLLRKPEWAGMFRDMLLSNTCGYNSRYVNNLFRLHQTGRDQSLKLFTLFAFEAWRSSNLQR